MATETENQAPAGKPAAAELKAASEQSKQREPRFSRDRLLGADGPKITGHGHRVIVGALEGDESEDFTRAGIKQTIEKWLDRKVEANYPTDDEKPEQEGDD